MEYFQEMRQKSIAIFLLLMLLIVSFISNCQSTSGAYLVKQGKALSESGNFQEAIELYNRALEDNPDLAEAYLHRGIAWHRMNQLHNAIDDYNNATNIKDDLTLAYYNRGNVYLRMGEPEKALADYKKTIELQPDFLKGHRDGHEKMHFFFIA